jgi:arginase
MPGTGWIRDNETPAGRRARPVGLIGAPCDVAAGTRGATMGPEALRVAGLPEALSGLGYQVRDHGNLQGPGHPGRRAEDGYRHLPETAAWVRAVRDAVSGAMASGEVPILLGGDHALSIGSVAAAAAHCEARRQPLMVLWIDAHADFNTAATSPSGNIHGMPVAVLCGEGPEDLCDLGTGRPVLQPEQVVQVGVRSVDAVEKRAVMENGLRVHDMRRIDEDGIRTVMAEVLSEVTRRGAHLHVSFDADVLDPEIAPGVGTPVRGGLNYREAQLCMEMIHDSGALGSLDVVEVNPALDTGNRTARTAVDLVESLFGEQILARVL